MRINAMILGRTDLRKGVSGAKFDAESDFEVRLAVAPQKRSQNCKKPKISHFFVSASKNETLGII